MGEEVLEVVSETEIETDFFGVGWEEVNSALGLFGSLPACRSIDEDWGVLFLKAVFC